jgi:hypothetical protein
MTRTAAAELLDNELAQLRIKGRCMNFDKLNEKQQYVLGCIACNQDGGHHPATLRVLLRRGLIEAYDVIERNFWTTRYRMPSAVHIAWCAYCVGHQ